MDDDLKPETNEEIIARTRKRLDEFVAHLDEGGDFSAVNVLELIADAQDLGNRLSIAADTIDALRERVKVLEGALEWYDATVARCNSYAPEGAISRDMLAKDGGAKARAALKDADT